MTHKVGGIFKSVEEQQSFPRGTVVFKKGEVAELMYVVKEGEVEIRLGEQVIETVGRTRSSGNWASSTARLAAPAPWQGLIASWFP